MKKAFLAVMLCVTFLFAMSLPAFAASIGVNINPDNYSISDVQCIASGSETWKKPSSYVFNTDDDGSGFLSIVDQAPVYWRAKFTPLESAGSLTVEPSMYLDCTMFYLQTSSPNYAMTPDGAMYVTTATGTVYEFPVTNVVEILNSSGTLAGYNVSFGGSVEVGSGFETGDCTIEFVCSGISNTGCVQVNLYQCTFIVTENPVTTNTAKIVESVDKAAQDIMANDDANTEEIKDKIDESTDEITGAIDNSTDAITGAIGDQTDEITNGWGTGDDTAGETDDFAADMEAAENEALGGKTDEEIEAEINEAFASAAELPEGVIGGYESVGYVFNDLLDAFGPDYESVLFLSLSLGLAAFLVGRSYKSKGDS